MQLVDVRLADQDYTESEEYCRAKFRGMLQVNAKSMLRTCMAATVTADKTTPKAQLCTNAPWARIKIIAIQGFLGLLQ